MAMGGLWESWTNQDGEILRTFCIITTGPNAVMTPIHDRMPVIVDKENWGTWLDPKFNDPSQLGAILAPFDPNRMEAWPVSRRVSSAREDGSELIERQHR